ncbi:MAG: Flp pilus assembly complex ATPase component TadA [Candidatus Omnitrophica bacterium]|nr:Flp pilus assembly complex ATPase component TadA [Candidatus Omnitrophota bacterium]
MTRKVDAILGDYLINKNLVSRQEWDDFLKDISLSQENIISSLVKKDFLSEKEALGVLAQNLNLEYVDLKKIIVDKKLIEKVPIRIAFYYNFVPLALKERLLTIAVSFPLDVKIQDEIRTHLGYNIRTVLAASDDVLAALKIAYGVGAQTLEKITSLSKESNPSLGVKEEKVEDLDDIEDLAEDASVIKLVNEIILEAYKRRATDIHIEPYRNDVSIRYRIDGVLYDVPASGQTKDFLAAIISRIKIMCNLNIVERRLPQDGRAIVKTQDQALDLRVSTLPTPYGESIVIRILPTKMLFSLEKLGLCRGDLEIFEELIRKPYGIIFVTGPTGSGKTTTLYACLSRINTRDRKIITLEDPIEYDIKGITQIQVQPEVGLDFARGLRSILRHDPDIIMVGEVRDLETAEIANRVALTGHLIFSTLHTNDAASGITRLMDIGIEPFLISSSVEAFIAQRLVRVICPYCKYEDTAPFEELRRNITELLRLDSEEKVKIFRGKGCDKCNSTGFFGRTAIYEILLVDDPIKELIAKKSSASEIKRLAVSRGMRTLAQDGWQKVINGVTTPEEVLRVISVEGYGVEEVDKQAFVFGDEGALQESEDSSERRTYERLDSKLNLRYKIFKDEKGEPQKLSSERITLTSNVSAAGIAFLAPEALANDSILEIHLDLPDGKEPLRCLGKVVWVKKIDSGDYEIGLSFLDLTSGERRRVNRYVTKE